MRFKLRSGTTIGYKVRGAGDVIALLHPIGLRCDFWDPVVEALADTFRVIAIDARGHGDSDVPGEPFTINMVADDCIELLRALSGPCVVVGCSMGGSVAQAIAVSDPGLVRGAVLANCSGPRTSGRSQTLEDRAARALIGMPAVLDESLARWFSKGFAAERPDVVAQVRKWLLEGDPVVHSWSWTALAGRSDDHYSRINQPVLVIGGSGDLASPPSSVKALAAALPHAAYLELPGAGHMSPLEQPEAFAAAVAKFLSQLSPVAPRSRETVS